MTRWHLLHKQNMSSNVNVTRDLCISSASTTSVIQKHNACAEETPRRRCAGLRLTCVDALVEYEDCVTVTELCLCQGIFNGDGADSHNFDDDGWHASNRYRGCGCESTVPSIDLPLLAKLAVYAIQEDRLALLGLPFPQWQRLYTHRHFLRTFHTIAGRPGGFHPLRYYLYNAETGEGFRCHFILDNESEAEDETRSQIGIGMRTDFRHMYTLKLRRGSRSRLQVKWATCVPTPS